MEIIVYGFIFYYLSALVGISIGYHRYFTHRSFETTVFFEYIMLFFGMLCGGRSPLTWAAVHRMHHTYSDTEKDPHSPIFQGKWKVILSKWRISYIPKKHIKDLVKNPRLVFFHKYGKYLHLGLAAITLLISINIFFIVIVFPFALSYIGFGLLNWATHKNGEPIDVPFMNILAPGEGWHGYHHSHPMHHRLNRFDPAGWLIERIAIKTKFGG